MKIVAISNNKKNLGARVNKLNNQHNLSLSLSLSILPGHIWITHVIKNNLKGKSL